jgi:hypothetical protein
MQDSIPDRFNPEDEELSYDQINYAGLKPEESIE